jgi:hypothetical protein
MPHGLQMRAAGDEDDIGAGLRQAGAEETSRGFIVR